MKISKIILVLVVFTLAYKSVSAQQSIIPDISEDYIARLVARAEENYPQVKSNQNKINIAQSNISKARASYLDAFTFSYIYQPQGINTLSGASGSSTSGSTSNYSYFNGIQAGIFFNLGTFLEKPYMVKAARQELEEANNDQNQYFLTLTKDVKTRYYTYLQDIAFLKLTTQACVDAESVANDMKHKFQKGEETFDNYTKAQATVTVNYESKIQAEANLLIAKANIEELIGDKLENIK